MKIAFSENHANTVFRPFIGTLLIFVFVNMGQQSNAQTHKLRTRGRTLVEAESFSKKSSVDCPRVAESEKCSGQRYLGYFWNDEWFELEVDVPHMLNYHVSLRVSSGEGSQIQVQMIDESGNAKVLGTIDIPKTHDYTHFTNLKNLVVSLPKGVQTLRFVNLKNGIDIDHITFSAGSEHDVVSFRPIGNDGPDINPLKGFGSSWWRAEEEHASVGFQYIEWGKLEPEDDAFDWDAVDEILNRPGTQGRHFILQFAVDWDDWGAKEPEGDSHYRGPDWLLDRVGENRGPAFPDDPDSRISRATRYNDPVFIEEATEAIKALCDHFRDDPRTFVLQTGLLGYWGEWHNYPRTDWSPTDATKKSILDAYLNNIGSDGLTQVRYPDETVAVPQARLGYTNGSATPTEHGYEFGKEVSKRELWMNGPIGGEWPPNVEQQYWARFFQTGEGISFLEQGGYSTMTPPEFKEIKAKLPGWKPSGLFMDMHRRMGYNFQTREVRHLVAVDDSGQTHIEVDLQNIGIAPFYKDWDVQLAILNADAAELVDLIKVDLDLRELGPTESITLAGTSSAKLDPEKRYQIGIRILQPGADESKTTAWNLKARNVYVVLANDIKCTEGDWDPSNALSGGWNLLTDIQRRQPTSAHQLEGRFFPIQGSFRPIAEQVPQRSKN